jgi:hypothetical protein
MIKAWSVCLSLMFTAGNLQATTLIGWAELPADTFTQGPTSGQFIESVNGRHPPFINQQPVQGFSSLVATGDGEYFALTDNGFGARSNSSDFILGWYLIKPHYRQIDGGDARIAISRVVQLSDPHSLLGFTLTRPDDRLLTGADLDPESFRQTPDGSFWLGDEFLPGILHFSASGELLAPPFTLSGLYAVDNPMGETATLQSSRGFEGMGQSQDGLWLYPMLEGEMMNTDAGLNIYSFDVANQKFVNPNANHPSYRYRLDQGSTAVGDFTMYSDSAGLMIERDSNQGSQARTKKIYQVDFKNLDQDGYLQKTLIVNLLEIGDPNDLNNDGQTQFSFPFWTIEGLVVIDATTLVVTNDNNYPFDLARSETKPDNTEFILLKIDPLWE